MCVNQSLLNFENLLSSQRSNTYIVQRYDTISNCTALAYWQYSICTVAWSKKRNFLWNHGKIRWLWLAQSMNHSPNCNEISIAIAKLDPKQRKIPWTFADCTILQFYKENSTEFFEISNFNRQKTQSRGFEEKAESRTSVVNLKTLKRMRKSLNSIFCAKPYLCPMNCPCLLNFFILPTFNTSVLIFHSLKILQLSKLVHWI